MNWEVHNVRATAETRIYTCRLQATKNTLRRQQQAHSRDPSRPLPGLAIPRRLRANTRASAGPTIHPSSAQDSHAPETLTWRQRTAEEWATSDFNQTAYASGSGVSLAQALFQGTPAGDYDDERRYTTAMVAFDADADGDSDLAIGNEFPYISEELFLNDGHGFFHQVDAGDLNDVQSDFTTALAAFDADGDGDQDIVVGNDDDDRVTGIDLFLNDGSGHTTQTDAGDLEHTRSTGLLPFDADGDGDIDLAVAHSGFGNALYLNDGAAHFTLVASGDFYGSRVLARQWPSTPTEMATWM